jgi:galactose mutarotase-like enzyme
MTRLVVAGARIVETTVDGFAARTLVSPQGTLEATFVTAAGMVGSSLRHQGAELLDPRGGVARYATQGGTMGLPLLHPWANRLEGFRYAVAGRQVALSAASGVLHLDGNGLPIHGLLPGRSRWEVMRAGATPSAARLETRMVFSPDAALLDAFPFPHELHLAATLRDDALVVETTLAATGHVAVPVSFGFHPYLRLPGVPREQWMVELPVRQRLVLYQRQLPTGAREAVRIDPAPLGDRTFDDAFLAPPDSVPFTVAGGGRRIAVEFVRGYTVAQVFTPAHAAFICFEPMTAPANALVHGGPDLRLVEPGDRFTAAFAIRVAPA